MKIAYLYLAVAIVAEVVATSAIKATEEFTRPWPVLVVTLGYGIAIYALAVVMKTLPVGITYALWAGLGLVLVVLLAIPLYGQLPDGPALVGIALILAGVVTINLFSSTVQH